MWWCTKIDKYEVCVVPLAMFLKERHSYLTQACSAGAKNEQRLILGVHHIWIVGLAQGCVTVVFDTY